MAGRKKQSVEVTGIETVCPHCENSLTIALKLAKPRLVRKVPEISEEEVTIEDEQEEVTIEEEEEVATEASTEIPEEEEEVIPPPRPRGRRTRQVQEEEEESVEESEPKPRGRGRKAATPVVKSRRVKN